MEGERGSRNKKFCQKRRQLRGPAQLLGFYEFVPSQCPRCDHGQHRRCLWLSTCFARRPPGSCNNRTLGAPPDLRAVPMRAPLPHAFVLTP